MRVAPPLLNGLLLTPLLVGCRSATYERLYFLQEACREDYFLEDEEIAGLTFYLSEEVFIQIRDVPEGTAGRDRILVARAGAAGRVVEVGEDFLRVRFSEEGSGAYFVTNPKKEEDFYWLGTKVEGHEGYVKVRSQKERIMLYEGQTFRVLKGGTARLQISTDEWRAFLEERTRVIGDPKRAPSF
jgi:hypothetical protein